MRVINVSDKSFTVKRNINNVPRNLLLTIPSDSTPPTDNSKNLLRLSNLGSGNNIVDEYFKIISVDTGSSQYGDTSSSGFIEFEFQVDGISQEDMKTYYNYQDTDGNYKYKEYQDNGTENIYGIIPREIPVKYIKNTIQTPFTNLDTEFNLSLYSQNNKAGIDNQLFCMFTEIRIITLNGQLNYFFKEFREQVVFDTPQTKRSFDVGDIFEYYDCDNKPINNGGTGPFKHDCSMDGSFNCM